MNFLSHSYVSSNVRPATCC